MESEEMYARCLGYARRVCPRDPAIDAEDIMQMAWLRAEAHLVALSDDEARRKYLNSAILTVAIDYTRRMGRRPISVQFHDHHGGGDVEAEVLVRLELAAAIARALADPLGRTALFMALGYSGREVAQALGVARATVNTRVLRFRAREAMEA